MKEISTYIKESFYRDVAHSEPYLWVDYCVSDGFQFGWSADIRDEDWWSIFDMNYLRNYYQKYCDVNKVRANIEHDYCFVTKYPRFGTRGSAFFDYNRESLMFAILNTKYNGEMNIDEIEKQVRMFLRHDNDSDKTTKIDIKKMKDISRHYEPYIYRVTITNNKLFPGGKNRALYIDIMTKEDYNKR